MLLEWLEIKLSKFLYPLQGLQQIFKRDNNFLYHIIAALIVILISFLLGINSLEWLFIISAIFFVLITEVINTAIEYTVDLFTDSYSIYAKHAKDLGALAVLLASIYAVIIGMIILLPYLIQLF